ncbi:MAG: integrin alpha, partial [Candidatus Thermoplasmatota archaeon]|nr:integrin alpha [Candidatus Thermoplasmatota archaeon]
MNRKAVSIIILCLMLLSTLPLSFHTTGGENEKTVKGPKASGGEVSDVKIVYNDTYKTINYTCWTSGTPSYSKWNGTSYNDLNTVKNAGVIRRNTTFNVTATGISSANKIKILGPCDVGEPRPNITTWSPQYDSTPDPDVWNFTVPSNAPVGDYQVYLNESYCTVYVIFDVFLTKTPSGMTENEFSGWAYNESNDAANYTICQYVGTEAVGKCYTFRERVTELVCSSMGGSTTTEYQAAIKLYGIVNARISWKGVAGSPAYDTEAILNENTGLTISYAKKIALQTGDTLPNGMVTQRNCANFGIFTPALIKSIGIPARTFNSGDGESVVDPNMWGWGDFDNTCQAYIEYPDMSMGPYYDDHSKRWIMIYSNDALEGDGGIGTQNSNGEGSIGTLQDLYFHARMLDIVPCTKADETNTWEWNGGDPAATAGWSVIDLGATDEIPSGLADPGAATHTGLPEVNLTTSDYGYLKGDLGCGDRDFFRVNVTGKSFVDIGFTEGADYAQIYVNNTTTGSNEPDFAPNGALKTAYYSSLVWGDDKCTATVPTGVNWFYIMIDNAKEFQYADDYAQDGHGATTYHAMAETHHYILGIGKCPPNVTVKSPNGNEVLIGGKSYNITWNATIINSSRLSSNCINISYSTDGGENWNTIDGAQGLSNIGYYIWSVPNKVNSDSVKINITCNTTDGKTGYDISDNSFTIRGSTPFRELSSGTGNATGDRFGWNVSYAGDLNNDGYDDIVVGAPYVTYNSVSECGAVYIFFGYSNISLGNLTATYANVSIYGTIADAHFGWSVSDAGKVDEASGGYDDIIIGEPDNGNGKAYLFFGRSTWNNTYNTTEANVTLAGEGANDRFGFSVSGAGDVNNDNYDDVVIGAYANGTDKGKAYIYYGGAVGAPTDSTVYVSSNVTTYGTIDGFDNAKVEDGNYATLTEELVSGMTLFYETFPTASAAWDGTGQDNPGWTVIQGSADADDIQVTDNAVITSGDTPSGLNYLEFFDCDDAFGSGYDLAWVGIDLSGYTGVVISYYWQLDDTDAGEGVMAEYSTDSTNGVDGTWPDIASHLGTTPHDVWTQQTFNLDDAACVANFKLRFSGYMGATTEQAWIDDVKINGSCYKMDIEFNTTSVVEAANYYLQLNYNVTSGGNFDVFVYNGATWDDIGDLTSTIRWTGLQIALNSNHRLGNGYVRVRYVAMTTTQDKLYIEYHRIRSYGTLGAPFTSSNVTLTGENANDKFGFSVSRAGDVNKDGYGDVVVGAPGYDNSRGSAYVFYGGGWLTGTHTVGSTITYNYSSGAGTNKWAYETSGLTSSKPSSGPEITAEIAIGSYTAIESSNDVRETTAIDASTYSAQRFRIILDEKPESITRIYIEWEGYADGGYVQIMYIWNFAISDWVALSWGLFGSDSRATWDFTS